GGGGKGSNARRDLAGRGTPGQVVAAVKQGDGDQDPEIWLDDKVLDLRGGYQQCANGRANHHHVYKEDPIHCHERPRCLAIVEPILAAILWMVRPRRKRTVYFFSSIKWPRWPITRCVAWANRASSHGNLTARRTPAS